MDHHHNNNRNNNLDNNNKCDHTKTCSMQTLGLRWKYRLVRTILVNSSIGISNNNNILSNSNSLFLNRVTHLTCMPSKNKTVSMIPTFHNKCLTTPTTATVVSSNNFKGNINNNNNNNIINSKSIRNSWQHCDRQDRQARSNEYPDLTAPIF